MTQPIIHYEGHDHPIPEAVVEMIEDMGFEMESYEVQAQPA